MTRFLTAAVLGLIVLAPSPLLADEGSNLDVQVLAANALGNVGGVSGTFLDSCALYDKTPVAGQAGKFTAKADCTDAAAATLALPMLNRYLEPLVWITENASGSYKSARHWCAETRVVIAIKTAAYESPSFREIGFWARDAAMSNDGTFVTFAKNDPRLHPAGADTLRDGSPALLFKFAAAGPCEINGSGDNPSHRLEFKPFVTYEGGPRRWEAVSGNHGIGYGEHWYRADILN